MAITVKPRVLILGHMAPSIGGPATYLSWIIGSTLTNECDLIPFNIGRPPKLTVCNNFGYSALWNSGPRRMLIAITTTLRHIFCFSIVVAPVSPEYCSYSYGPILGILGNSHLSDGL